MRLRCASPFRTEASPLTRPGIGRGPSGPPVAGSLAARGPRGCRRADRNQEFGPAEECGLPNPIDFESEFSVIFPNGVRRDINLPLCVGEPNHLKTVRSYT